jgi:hypothetical protein
MHLIERVGNTGALQNESDGAVANLTIRGVFPVQERVDGLPKPKALGYSQELWTMRLPAAHARDRRPAAGTPVWPNSPKGRCTRPPVRSMGCASCRHGLSDDLRVAGAGTATDGDRWGYLGTQRFEPVISPGRYSELLSTYSRYIGSKESEG